MKQKDSRVHPARPQSEREIEEKDRKIAEEERKRFDIEKKDFDDAQRARERKSPGLSQKGSVPKRMQPGRAETAQSDRTTLPPVRHA